MNDGSHSLLADVGNHVIANLWLKIHGFLDDKAIGRSMVICKAFKSLSTLIKSIHYTKPPFTQRSLEAFVKTFPNVEILDIRQEYDEASERKDWSKLSLPQLRRLRIACCPLKTVEFKQANTPLLESLTIDTAGPHPADRLHLSLPHLDSVTLDFVHVRHCSIHGKRLCCTCLQR